MGLKFEPLEHPKTVESWYRQSTTSFEYGFRTWVNHTNVDCLEEVIEWCRERFGAHGPGHRWYTHDVSFWIRDANDAMEFKLRWL